MNPRMYTKTLKKRSSQAPKAIRSPNSVSFSQKVSCGEKVFLFSWLCLKTFLESSIDRKVGATFMPIFYLPSDFIFSIK